MFASMDRITRSMSAIALAGLFMTGCADDPAQRTSEATRPGFMPALAPAVGFVSEETTINNYVVHFDGRTVANGQTTFSYTVRGTGVDPSLSHFTLELPSCAPALAAYNPTGSANINTNQSSGIYGIEWHLSVADDNFEGRTYSITFAGDVELGIVRAEVKTEGGASGVGDVLGPCGGYRVSGAVFVDADGSGAQSAVENGIAGVTVEISDGAGAQSAITGPDGGYEFVVKEGTYTVGVSATTPASDFNEDLFASFTAHTATAFTSTVGPNATHDFGFSPQTDKLIADFDLGVLATAGKPVKFWLSELKSAAAGRTRGAYDGATLLGFLNDVAAIGVTVPFQFTPGNEFKEAIAILSASGNDPAVKFTKELLAAELNYVSGNTLVNENDLHLVLVLWGEELLVLNQGTPTTLAAIGTAGSGTKNSPYQGGTDLLGLVNGSTGGGGGDE